MDSISFMHAATPVLAPTMLDAPSGPNLDLLCIHQTSAAPFFENYAKLILIQNTYRKDWIGVGEIFGSKFSRLTPDYRNIQLYDLLIVCPFNTGHLQYC